MKKLYVLAALEIEQFRRRIIPASPNLPSGASTSPGKGAAGMDAALSGLMTFEAVSLQVSVGQGIVGIVQPGPQPLTVGLTCS